VISEAVLYLPHPADVALALLAVAGRPLGFRLVMGLLRAGVRRVWMPAGLRGTAVHRALAGVPSAHAAIVWTEGTSLPPAGPALLIPATAWASCRTLAMLVEAAAPAVFAGASATSAAVVVATPAMLRAAWPSIAAGDSVSDALDRALKSADVEVRPSAADFEVLTGPANIGRLEARMVLTLGSPIDTRLDTVFHRRLSRPVSLRAAKLGVGPNAVTFGSLVVGLVAAWGFWQGTPIAAALGLIFYAAAVVLDHADGEVARLTFSESTLGEWFDVTADTVVHALLVAALGVSTDRVAGGGGAALGVVAAVGVVVSAWLAKTSPPTAGGGVSGIVNALGNRDGFYAMLVLYIIGLATVPRLLPWLMIVVAAGCHAYWFGRIWYGASGRRP
jgi:phosphatidylglycerophosphate synthase